MRLKLEHQDDAKYVDFLRMMYYNGFVVDPFKSLGRRDFDLIICTRSFKSTHDFIGIETEMMKTCSCWDRK